MTVKASPIHGRGLFAKRKIRKGLKIGVLRGRKSSDPGHYAMIVVSDEGNREVKAEGPLKYVNHSEDPNAELYTLDEDGSAELIATRTILPNEEITIDYAGDL